VRHDIQCRAFLVQPAREHARPGLAGLKHIKLHEGAGEMLGFPWRGLLARAQADDRVAHLYGLAGL